MFVISNLLRAVLAQHLVHLVRPLDDDPLDGVLELNVALLATRSLCLSLLLVDVLCSLREREESLALDVTPDLVDAGGEFVDLLLYICRVR